MAHVADASRQPADGLFGETFVEDFEMSEIEIIECDSREWLADNSSRLLRQFDCIITDPPYDSLMKWQGVGTTARMGFGAGKDAAESKKFYPTIDREDMQNVLRSLFALAKDNTHTYVMADGEYMPIILNWVRENPGFGWKYSKPLVWDKVNAGMGYHWRGTHEFILMLDKGKRRLNDLGKQDVLRHRRVTGGYPTEKPIGLIEDLLLNSTKEGDWVLDPFMGGGTTAVACQKHNRNCVTLDISPRAIAYAKSRLSSPSETLLAI